MDFGNDIGGVGGIDADLGFGFGCFFIDRWIGGDGKAAGRFRQAVDAGQEIDGGIGEGWAIIPPNSVGFLFIAEPDRGEECSGNIIDRDKEGRSLRLRSWSGPEERVRIVAVSRRGERVVRTTGKLWRVDLAGFPGMGNGRGPIDRVGRESVEIGDAAAGAAFRESEIC